MKGTVRGITIQTFGFLIQTSKSGLQIISWPIDMVLAIWTILGLIFDPNRAVLASQNQHFDFVPKPSSTGLSQSTL